MRKLFKIVVSATFLLLSLGAAAQTAKTEVWSPAQLLERARHLKQLAAQGDGSASEILEKYPHHYTMLAFRNRNGGGELHQNYADLFYILDGGATLMTGGELVDPKTIASGEIRGASVKGGVGQEVKAGDVVHIPADTPHQMLVPDGSTVTYFVVKVQENE
jgi:mannose-6-phosphate isomerase-like protein (cupin superfamily)